MLENIFSAFNFSSNSSLRPLSRDEKQILQQQEVIDENGPGTILRDFQTLLDFIGEKGIEVSGKLNFLPMKLLPEINGRLSHPMQLQLKRPQQKSYSYIHGLYLLLRASELTSVKAKGKKQILVLEPEVVRSWNSLNPTERYFTLLETWMIRGNQEILGEHQGFQGTLLKCFMFWKNLPDKGLKMPDTSVNDMMLSHYPGLHNLALLDMFGFIEVQQGKPKPGKGWQISSIRPLPLGKAILPFLAYLIALNDYQWQYEIDMNAPFGELQAGLQPYFPEFQNNLAIPTIEFKEGIYVFKVSWRKIWRRIAIPANLTLDYLSSAILEAIEFDFDHLYQFIYKSRFGGVIKANHPALEEHPWVNEVRIGDLPLSEGEIMTFFYDFGDCWEFDVKLEKINPVDSNIEEAVILESYGESPEQYPNWEEYDEEGDDEDE